MPSLWLILLYGYKYITNKSLQRIKNAAENKSNNRKNINHCDVVMVELCGRRCPVILRLGNKKVLAAAWTSFAVTD